MEMHWSSPFDLYKMLFLVPETYLVLPVWEESPVWVLRNGTWTTYCFFFVWFVVLLFGKYETRCIPNSESSPHPEMVLFLLQSEGSGTDLFSFRYLFATLRKRDLWNSWTSCTIHWGLISLPTGWVKTWLWGGTKHNIKISLERLWANHNCKNWRQGKLVLFITSEYGQHHWHLWVF